MLESYTFHTLPVFTVGVWNPGIGSFRLLVAILRHSSSLSLLVTYQFVRFLKHLGRCDNVGQSVFALAAMRIAILIVSRDPGLHKMARVDLRLAYNSLLSSHYDEL